MRNSKVLEMLNSGRIEELKKQLEDEIYEEALKTKPGAKQRYMAMKKYFTYCTSAREALQKPCVVEYEGSQYTSFCNSYSLALTLESTGEIELFDTSNGNYPDVTQLIRYDGDEEKIDISKVIAEAKSKGYKLKKSEVGFDYNYLLLYGGSYFKIGLIDATYGIINNSGEATLFHVKGINNPLTITTDLGIAFIMPIRYDGDPIEDGKIVIEI